MRIEVHKFGGTSVLGAQRMRGVAELLIDAGKKARVVAVASAMSGVTNLLVEATAAAKAGNREAAEAALKKVRVMHVEALDQIAQQPAADDEPVGPVRDEVMAIIDDVANVIRGAELVGEVTARTRDRIVAAGEKLSVRLIALILRRLGHKAQAVDADTFIDTDAAYSDANPLPFVTDRGIDSFLRPRLERGETPVVTGFMGRAPDGSTTTFSRGGSDFTATLVGGALNADEVTIWTDVDGVFTADPRVVPGASLIPQLNYREAGEMSYYGAKVLHQRTMIPVSGKRIPVWVRNTLNPAAPGSVVDGRSSAPPSSGSGVVHPVKAVTAIKDQALLSLEGKGMSGVPGVSARLFSCLASRSISVTMISQSSSESSVCLAVPGPDALAAEGAIKQEFRADISRGDIEDVTVRQGVALVAAVGLGMAHTPGVAGNVFTSLGEHGVNVLAIAQGSSELNITLAVDQAEAGAAVAAIHERFALDQPGAAVRTRRTRDLVILGCGQVGRALIELVRERARREDAPERLRIVGIADRGGYLFKAGGISDADLCSVVKEKEAKRPLSSVSGAKRAETTDNGLEALWRAAASARLAAPILVDTSDSDATAAIMAEALSSGFDVATANKRPIGESWGAFESIRSAVVRSGRTLRAEATVGAGLPVIDTLATLRATGDIVTRIEGCFSGTLGFVMTALQDGAKFSDVVGEAVRLGYTEPDPVADLCGADVARKAVILARLSGLVSADCPVKLTGLVSDSLLGRPLDALLSELRAMDAALEQRVAEARRAGNVLRFAATVQPNAIEVGPAAVPADSALGTLRGTDNMIVFHTARYSRRPLVISGPGAGAVVTASGVLADILRLCGGSGGGVG